jgi:ATPase family associated with various cellular activities (AAA)
MPSPRIEEVFKINGVPTYTFVRPKEYDHLLVSLRTPGRGVVVEGPSGIGKTTAVEKVLSELALGTSVTKLTARNQQDVEYIADLRSLGSVGTVIIDDFHKLDDHVKALVADYLKTLADEENPSVKLVIIGINRAGDRLPVRYRKNDCC